MHSSTSNSEFENQYQTVDNRQELKVRAKTFIATFSVFACIIGLYLFLASLVDLNGRVLGMMDYTSQLAIEHHEKKKIMVFGTSMVQAGFEPDLFDEILNSRGMDVVSYNYGVGNLNPEFQQYVTRQIKRDLEAANEQLDLVLLEFNPFQTTKARDVLGAMTRDQNEAVLLTPSDLWKITLEDPNRGIRLFNIRYLRDGFSAEIITSALLLDGPPTPPSEERQEASRRRSELQREFYASIPEGETVFPGGWSRELRGGRLNKSLLSQESLELLLQYSDSFRHPALMESDLQRRIDQGDILELDFEERLVQAFINMVNDLNAIANNMEIILLPRNTDWVVYTPEVQSKLNSLMARIFNETGVPVRDFQDHPSITPEMFVDTTHLSFSRGIDAFSYLLAATYEQTIRENE